MKNGKVLAVQATLRKHGITIDTDVALDILAAVSTRTEAEYEVGDFVELYEGMGEVGFGEIRKVNGDGTFAVEYWNESKEEFTFTNPRRNEISRLSSKEEAREYFLIRSGQKEMPRRGAKYTTP